MYVFLRSESFLAVDKGKMLLSLCLLIFIDSFLTNLSLAKEDLGFYANKTLLCIGSAQNLSTHIKC